MGRRTVAYLLAGPLLAVIMLSCSGKGRVIPEGEFADIYADLLVSDGWLRTKGASIADSTLFYERVFRPYGYTTQDYLASVSRYMEDPERYSEILSHAADILAARTKAAERARSFREAAENAAGAGPMLFASLFRGQYSTDSVRIAYDSLRGMWGAERFVYDTMFSGPAKVAVASPVGLQHFPERPPMPIKTAVER